MRGTTVLAILIIMLLSLFQPISAQTYDFGFVLTTGEEKQLTSYSTKPIVLDWAASWCTICKQNQQRFNNIYDSYKSMVNFLSISYGGSGDSLEDVASMKGSFPWPFGLDTEDVASDLGVRNGYVWILDTDLTLIREWEYQIVDQSELTTAIDALLAGEIDEARGSELVSTTDNIESFGLESNPLFIGFLGLVAILVVIIFSKGSSSGTSENKRTSLQDKINQSKKNWDWYEE